jgi:hypothetical protein
MLDTVGYIVDALWDSSEYDVHTKNETQFSEVVFHFYILQQDCIRIVRNLSREQIVGYNDPKLATSQ